MAKPPGLTVGAVGVSVRRLGPPNGKANPDRSYIVTHLTAMCQPGKICIALVSHY